MTDYDALRKEADKRKVEIYKAKTAEFGEGPKCINVLAFQNAVDEIRINTLEDEVAQLRKIIEDRK